MKKYVFYITSMAFILITACSQSVSFNDQIVNDISSLMGTGICDSIPEGSTISNIVVGEIVPIGETGMIDVSMEFDHEQDGVRKHQKGAMLYTKSGNVHKLEAIGGCDYGVN